jgi:hypothetical protein
MWIQVFLTDQKWSLVGNSAHEMITAKVVSMDEHPSTQLGGPRVELGTERESFLQVLDENTNFGGQPAAGGPYGKDRHGSLKGSQKTDTSNTTFSSAR